MSAYKLRWFSLGGLLGLLGIPLDQPLLYALFGLFVFTTFFSVDERTEVNLGRAAAFAYVVTLSTFLVAFVLLAALVATRTVTGLTRVDFLEMLVIAFAAIFALHILSFALSYEYFDRKGV